MDQQVIDIVGITPEYAGVIGYEAEQCCHYCDARAVVRISWKDPIFAGNSQEHEVYMCLSHEMAFDLGTDLGVYYDIEFL